MTIWGEKWFDVGFQTRFWRKGTIYNCQFRYCNKLQVLKPEGTERNPHANRRELGETL